jgi:hypothetical protein
VLNHCSKRFLKPSSALLSSLFWKSDMEVEEIDALLKYLESENPCRPWRCYVACDSTDNWIPLLFDNTELYMIEFKE